MKIHIRGKYIDETYIYIPLHFLNYRKPFELLGVFSYILNKTYLYY
jgi:hypothetical protein